MCYLLGRMVYFAVFGFLAIVAIGPVVGIVGALLPFAIIGVVAVGLARAVNWLVRKRKVENRPVEVALVRRAPVAAPREVPARPERQGGRGRVVLEVLCGGLVGGLVAGAISWQTPELAGTVIPAVVAGAVVGYVVGGTAGEKGRSSCSGEACC